MIDFDNGVSLNILFRLSSFCWLYAQLGVCMCELVCELVCVCVCERYTKSATSFFAMSFEMVTIVVSSQLHTRTHYAATHWAIWKFKYKLHCLVNLSASEYEFMFILWYATTINMIFVEIFSRCWTETHKHTYTHTPKLTSLCDMLRVVSDPTRWLNGDCCHLEEGMRKFIQSNYGPWILSVHFRGCRPAKRSEFRISWLLLIVSNYSSPSPLIIP